MPSRKTSAGSPSKQAREPARKTPALPPPPTRRVSTRGKAAPPEFVAQLALMASLSRGVPLGELTPKDIERIAAEADLDRGEVARIAACMRLERHTGIAGELLYGVTHAGELPDLDTLLNQPQAVLRKRLAASVKSGTVRRDIAPELAALEALRPQHETIAHVAERAGIVIPPRLQALLRGRKLATLDDIVRVGGVRQLAGADAPKNDAVVTALDALAEFSLLPDGMEAGPQLLRAGYRGIAAVARTAPRALARHLDGGAAEATRLRDAAIQQSRVAFNFVTGQRVAGELDFDLLGESSAYLLDTCHCCSDAAGSLAYLSDLLDYAVRHTSYAGQVVDLAFLEARLHQPFGGLPVECAGETEVLRQVRICIEVLRDMLSAPEKTFASQAYLETAYRRFLELFGTSFDEMRALPAMKRLDAEALAGALQVRSAAQLDDLRRDPDAPPAAALAITEAWLEQMFGLRDTTRPPLQSGTAMPWTLAARLDFWRTKWRADDADDGRSALGAHPLLDPDLVGLADLADLPAPRWQTLTDKTQWSALDFIEARSQWVNVCIGALNTFRKPAGAPARSFAQMLVALAQPLTIPDVAVGVTADLTDVNDPLKRLVAAREERDRGGDISAWLAQVMLSDDEFELFSRMATVESLGLVIAESEWKDFNSALIHRARKLEVLQTWRNEERNAAVPVSISPETFHLRASIDAPDWTPSTWRSDPALRRRWELTLRGRIAQQQSLAEQVQTAVDTVERELFVALRDERMAAAAAQGLLGGGAGLLTLARQRWFTANLLIDGETSDCARTTRVEQAIKTLQGLLFGIRNGLLEDTAWDIDDPAFDDTWQWLGTYATWNAAMQVFLHPQRALRPTLRRLQSPGFAAMVEACRAAGRLSAEDIRTIAADYRRYFLDVCSLVPAAAHAAGVPKRTFFAVGSSSASGAFMFSHWTEAPGWGAIGAPDQAPWAYLEWDAALQDKRAASEPELANLVPFCDAQGRHGVAVFVRLRSVAQVVWAKSVWLGGASSRFSACDAPPPLLLTDQRHALPAVRAATAAAVAWRFATGDVVVPLRTVSPESIRLLLYAGSARNGVRRVGLARSDRAGQALAAEMSLDAGWSIPDPASPVVFGQRVLAVNDAAGQIGWIDFAGDQLSLVSVVGQVGGAAGSWPVSLGSGQRRTVFRAANLDGGGRRLLAFEYVDPPVPAQWLSPVRTFVSVFSVSAASLTFDHREALDLDYVSSPAATARWVYYPDQGSQPDGIRWEKFTVMRSGFGPSGSSDASRDDILVHALDRTEKYAGHTTDPRSDRLVTQGTNQVMVQALLRWDPNNIRFVTSDVHWTIPEVNALAMAHSAGGAGWNVGAADEYLPITGGANRPQRLLAFNTTALKLALLAFDAGGRLQTRFLVDGQVTDSSGLAWTVAAGDRLFAGQFLAPGSAAAILVNFSNANLCVLDVRGDTLLPVFSESDYRLESPGGPGLTMRPAGAYDATCLDIDNDGLDELILTPVGAGLLPGYSVWHGLPAPFATVNSAAFGGPTGVTEFEVLALARTTQERLDRAARIQAAYLQNAVPGREQNLLYLDEAYYFVAVELAIRLHDAGALLAALDALRCVYDYEASGAARLVTYKLVLDAGIPTFSRTLNWLRDPLSPHAIAETRKGAYQAYTRLLTARFLLDCADADFTLATPESVNRARETYLKALDLLPAPAAGSLQADCAGLIGELTVTIGEGSWILPQLQTIAREVKNRAALKQALADVAEIAASEASEGHKAGGMLEVLKKAARGDDGAVIAQAMEAARNGADAALLPHVAAAHGGVRHHLEMFRPLEFVPAPSMAWCIAEDTEAMALRRRAENNLRKIRNCLNIAGLEMGYEAIAVDGALDFSNVENAAQLRALTRPRLTPLPYRYATLIERAKQLADLARQMEQSMLATLQYADQKRFELLKARQELSLTRSGVRLRDLQVIQADSARVSAELQRDQTQYEVDTYEGRLRAGRTLNEEMALAFQAGAVAFQTASAAAAFAGMASPQTFFQWAGAAAGPLSSAAQAAASAAQLANQSASLENQDKELRLRAGLSRQGLRIGNQGIKTAKDGVYIAMQERNIAQAQVRQAEEVLDFLDTGQFGNVALYEWMSGVLEGVYRFFLQQATSITQMAATQLEAMTQTSVPVTVRDDYAVPLETGMSSAAAPGEGPSFVSKGLTGSAQLLRDIYELDQYAFQINKRKLQLVETLSLAQLDIVAFQRFRQTGVLVFEAPMALFDRRFPGHYLRLIQRVRTSLVALIPVTTGIRATLSTSGISRVVIGDELFSTKTVRRAPESVALSSAWNATGYFELDPQPELLAFAEGAGVDARWQLDMPRAANPAVDYDSIADILFTIDYTALASPDYKRVVVKELSRDIAGERAFSFSHDFADAWYELNNPDVCATPLTVTFVVRPADFPPNIEPGTLLSAQLALYFVHAPGDSLAALSFKLVPPGGTAPAAYWQPDAAGVASTRRAMALPVGASPSGTWTLEVLDSPAARRQFSDRKVRDILFVVGWQALAPPWGEA